jgi:hypothetical protein
VKARRRISGELEDPFVVERLQESLAARRVLDDVAFRKVASARDVLEIEMLDNGPVTVELLAN